jgi:hypothetical protein
MFQLYAVNVAAPGGGVVAYRVDISAAGPGETIWIYDNSKQVECDDLAKAVKSDAMKDLVRDFGRWLHDQVRRAVKESDNPDQWIQLRATLRHGLREIMTGMGEGRTVSLMPFTGEDLRLAHDELAKRFPEIDREVEVLFVMREEIVKGEPKNWAAGKSRDGDEVQKLGECKRVSIAVADIYKAAYGYAPDFIITFCAAGWSRLNAAKRRYLVHHELCHIGYDSVKRSLWVAAHDVEEFGAVLEAHAPTAWLGGRTSFIEAAIAGAVEFHQLDMFGVAQAGARIRSIEPASAAAEG